MRSNLSSFLAGLSERVLSFLFPEYCLSCGRYLPEGGLLCPECEESLPINRNFCPVCARPYPEGVPPHPCGDCLSGRPFSRVLAPFLYVPPVSDWIKRLKFAEDFTLARGLSRLLRKHLPRELSFDLVVPVPLGRKRLFKRGFNQSALLARLAFGRLDEILVRTRETPPQSELPASERGRNVRRAFSVKDETRVFARRVLLVDDVMTTGATVEECARVLRAAGAREVTVAVLARA